MPGFDRTDRQGEEIRRVLDHAIRTEVKDPRIVKVFSITSCEVTRDLNVCKVRISAMGTPQERKDMFKALRGAAGFLRWYLGQNMMLRVLPTLVFQEDTTIEYSVRIQKILDDIAKQEQEKKMPSEPEDGEEQ